MSQQDLTQRVINDFTYHRPDPAAVDRMRQLRTQARTLAKMIAELVPPGREQASALTRLEESVMHANAGITRPFPGVED